MHSISERLQNGKMGCYKKSPDDLQIRNQFNISNQAAQSATENDFTTIIEQSHISIIGVYKKTTEESQNRSGIYPAG